VVGHVRRARPLIAALDRRRSPTSIHARTLTRRTERAGARVVRLGRPTSAVRSVGDATARIRSRARVVALTGGRAPVRTPGRCAPRIGPGDRVVTGADTGATVRTVHRSATAERSGPWVVPGAVTVRRVMWEVDGKAAGHPDVWRIVVTAAPHRTAPPDHHAAVRRRRCKLHP